MAQDTRDIFYTYKGARTKIKAVTAQFCPACNEYVATIDESERITDEMLAFQRKTNALRVNPGFVRTVRRKLGLGQKEAGVLFGGGVNAFSRYEKGVIEPPVATVQLLRVLDRHPELLEEVRADTAATPASA
jgi:HTH-type transcriptional regulator/antitoxin MqsA